MSLHLFSGVVQQKDGEASACPIFKMACIGLCPTCICFGLYGVCACVHVHVCVWVCVRACVCLCVCVSVRVYALQRYAVFWTAAPSPMGGGVDSSPEWEAEDVPIVLSNCNVLVPFKR